MMSKEVCKVNLMTDEYKPVVTGCKYNSELGLVRSWMMEVVFLVKYEVQYSSSRF